MASFPARSPLCFRPSLSPRPRLARCLPGLMLALLPAVLTASGTRVGFKDAFATARGNAFVATADNPSAVYYNPAGLTQLQGHNLSVSAYIVRLETDYEPAAGPVVSLKRTSKVVPQLYYAWAPEGSRWAAGLGVYAPFGLLTEWPDNSGFRTFATRNEETYTTINPVFAWRVSDMVSLGGGLTFNRVDVDLRRGLGLAPGDQFRFKADGRDTGFNLGLRWQPDEKHAFGISYQHRTSFGLGGTADAAPFLLGEPASANLVFPSVLIVGWSYRPTPLWNLEVNFDRTNWSVLDTLTIAKPSGAVTVPFYWKSSWFYEFGVTRHYGDHWQFSAGYLYVENSVPDATFNPAVPDANRNFWSAGAGCVSGNLRFAITLQRATSAARRVHTGIVTATGETPDGTYRNPVSALSVSLAYRF